MGIFRESFPGSNPYSESLKMHKDTPKIDGNSPRIPAPQPLFSGYVSASVCAKYDLMVTLNSLFLCIMKLASAYLLLNYFGDKQMAFSWIQHKIHDKIIDSVVCYILLIVSNLIVL